MTMTYQPLLLWRKAVAHRAPNAIEDLDEFDRNMGCVQLNVAIYPSGIMFMNNRYSTRDMGEIAALFASKRIPAGDITPKPPRRNHDPHRKVSSKGKIKYDPDNLGVAHLWVPFDGYKRWVTLECANPDMEGTPLWLHKTCMKLAKFEADKFCSREEQSSFRATLFEKIAQVTEKSSEKHRKLLGRALAHKPTAQGLRRHVEVMPEHVAFEEVVEDQDVHPFDADPYVIDNNLAGTNRKDAHELIPRPRSPKGKKPSTWAETQRAKQRGVPARAEGKGKRKQSQSTLKRAPNSSTTIGLTWKE